MSIAQIPFRYAKALFDYAKEKGETEQIFKDISFIREVVAENRELARMFQSPVVKNYKKAAVIKAVFGDHISEATHKFFTLVTNKGREGYIRAIADTYIRIYNESRNILDANITTAIALDDTMRNAVKARIKAEFDKDVNLTEIVDPKIIGGFILRVKDKQDDKSIKSKLTRLKRDFESNRMSA